MKTRNLKTKDLLIKNLPLTMMSLPAFIVIIVFQSVPLFGLVLAFKNFTYRKGIFGSDWVGLANFKYVLGSGEVVGVLGKTVGYHLLFEVAVMVSAVFLAIMLYFVKGKKSPKLFQSATIAPYLTSYVIISYIVYLFLQYENGILNRVITVFGGSKVTWYNEPSYWPLILTICVLWFGAGIKSVYYYGSLMAIDESLFEAVDLDGGTRWHKIRHVMLPALAPILSIMMITGLGQLLASPFGLFYNVPLNSAALYPTTDVLSTYIYRGLVDVQIGTTTALTIFTSIVTLIFTFLVNAIIKKISPDNALF